MNTTLDLINVTATVAPTIAPLVLTETNDAPDLDKLLKEILELQSDIDSCSLISSVQGKRGLILAIKNGGKLLELQREVECKHKRGWKKWCKKNITTIEYETVRHYIRLWNFDLVEHDTLMTCQSIREAYYLVGIFKRKVKPQPRVEEPLPIVEQIDGETENNIEVATVEESRIDKAKLLVKQIEALSKEVTEEERESFRKVLYPLIDLIFKDKGTSLQDNVIFDLAQKNAAERAKKFQREMNELAKELEAA